MSPAMLIFLPLTLLLLMSKGAGAHAGASTAKKPESEKVMGVLTEDSKLIPVSSAHNYPEIDRHQQGIVIEQNGQRYLLATIEQ